MKDYAVDKIRNIALVGHGSSGKTSLAAAFLFDTGATGRLTKVDKGNTVTDYDPDEIERKISINATPCFCEWKDHKINVIDTPGYSNFLWDTRAALRAVDGAAVLVDAVAGVEVGTEKVWEMIEERGLPRIFVINKMDRENANFGRTLESVQQFFGRAAVPVELPIGEEKNFAGVVDIVEKKAYLFEKDESGKMSEAPVPAAMADDVERRNKELIELVAESDEKLMEKYFEKGELAPEEFRAGLKKSILHHQIFPVFAASGLANIGAQTVLDGILAYMPSPVDVGAVKARIKGEDKSVPPSPDAPFAAIVFKTISDPYTGRISLMRVFSGRTNPDGTVFNATRDIDEKLGGLFFLQGKEQVAAGQAKAGDIVATAKLKVTATGDTLNAKGSGIDFEPIKFPLPSISFAIEPKTRADEDRISQATHRIIEEDPTVRIERDPNTSQLLISGNGELHVRIITERLKKRYNVDVELKPPKISYLETIKGFEFEDKIFGGSIPRNFIPSVEKGLQEARKKGVLAGYPTVDFKAILYDGSYHDVDSSDIAFKIAASKAYKKGLREAKPTLLEPVMNVEIYTPEAYMGDIMGNLNGRRGKVQGMEQKGTMRVLKAQVPMSEMLDFEPTLTSITGGRGSFLMEFSHYEEAPSHIQQKIIAEAVKEGRVRPEEED
jgi:elongation factor G